MKFAGRFGVIVGLMMLGMWSFFLVSGQVPELHTEPYRITFHLAAEFTTAISLCVTGIGLLKNLPWAIRVYPAAAGMLVYSVIVSPGYYAQQGQWAFVGMFAFIFALGINSIFKVIHTKRT